jgi:hypothetical protein
MPPVMVRIPESLRDRIDAARPSTTSREAWVREACEAALASRSDAPDGTGQALTPAVESRRVGRDVGPDVEPGPASPRLTPEQCESLRAAIHDIEVMMGGDTI